VQENLTACSRLANPANNMLEVLSDRDARDLCLSQRRTGFFGPQNSILLSHENVLQPGSYNTTSLIHLSSEKVFALAWKKVAAFGNDTLGDNSLVNAIIFHSTNICRK
jgi:hypothetical protein